MTILSTDLLARIADRACNPERRYMLAAEDETAVALPVEEIDRKFESNLPGGVNAFRMMQERMTAMGFNMPTMSFVETSDGSMFASSDAPGVKPLPVPPTDGDWQVLERIVGRPIAEDLKQLYSIADGGFGPGFRGLLDVFQIGASCEDLRRRGPDYCGTIAYPDCFVPIAEERLNYHYDLDTGRIISSNQDWQNDELEPDDIYDIAFPGLAAMMEHWLAS